MVFTNVVMIILYFHLNFYFGQSLLKKSEHQVIGPSLGAGHEVLFVVGLCCFQHNVIVAVYLLPYNTFSIFYKYKNQ